MSDIVRKVLEGTDPRVPQALTALDDERRECAARIAGLGKNVDLLVQEKKKLREALEEIEQVQPKTIAMLRREGFVFETPLNEIEGWEKLAFTLYTIIVETDLMASVALHPEEQASVEFVTE